MVTANQRLVGGAKAGAHSPNEVAEPANAALGVLNMDTVFDLQSLAGLIIAQ